jgi:hypothetical protein
MVMVSVTAVDSKGSASSDVYYSGFDHGCADAGISNPNDRYLNQPGKEPPFHTISFMTGYNDGFYFCTGNSEEGIRIHN